MRKEMLDELNVMTIKRQVDDIETHGEKIQYLADIKDNLDRILECFRNYHFYNFRNLINDGYKMEGDCYEFLAFIKQQLLKYSNGREDRRVFNNDRIFAAVREKIRELEKLNSYVENELDLLSRLQLTKSDTSYKKKQYDNQFDVDEFVITEELDNKNMFTTEAEPKRVNFIDDLPDLATFGVPENTFDENEKIEWKGSKYGLEKFFDKMAEIGIIPAVVLENRDQIINKHFRFDKIPEFGTFEPNENLAAFDTNDESNLRIVEKGIRKTSSQKRSFNFYK